MKNIIFYWLCLALLSSGYGCKEKEMPKPAPKKVIGDLLITNEGTFNFNNASLGLYDITQDRYTPGLYKSNNKEDLGDILQSVFLAEKHLWLVVNNSNKIVILNRKTFKKTGEITGLSSPRYLIAIDSNTLWASDFKSGEITVIDRKNKRIDHRFTFAPGWSEQMFIHGNTVWVTHPSLYNGTLTNHLYGIDIQTEKITDSIEVLASPVRVIAGEGAYVWVYCQGHTASKSPGGIVEVNLNSKAVARTVHFKMNGSNAPLGVGLNFDRTENRLYYLRGDIFEVDLRENTIHPKRIISAEGKTFYALYYHNKTKELYVADAIDFVQRGQIERYTRQGVPTGSFRAGIIPNGFYDLGR